MNLKSAEAPPPPDDGYYDGGGGTLTPPAGTEIPDDDVPLGELPIDIPDGDVPLSELPEPEDLAEIPDDDVPLAELPQTGLLWWPVPLMAAAGLALVALGLFKRARASGTNEK